MALDEATTAFVARMAAAAAGQPQMQEMEPAAARARSAPMRAMYGEGPAMARREDVVVATPSGDVRSLLLVPKGDVRGLIVYYHGGGWVLGAADDNETLCRKIAEATSCAIAIVDYRLAPEHPFPTGLDDSWATFTWLHDHVAEVVGSPVPLIVAGDSAGANFATVVARRARDAGKQIALQVLIYPITDCDMTRPSYTATENQVMFDAVKAEWFFNHYAPDESIRTHPDISPIRAEDLSGMAPAVVVTAEHDPLRDEGVAYAERLAEVDGLVESRTFEGQMHGFFTMTNILPASDAAIAYLVPHVAGATG